MPILVQIRSPEEEAAAAVVAWPEVLAEVG
jgi:hypothetical protein